MIIGVLKIGTVWLFSYMVVGQNLRYLFSRDYHLFKRFFKGHRGYGVLTHSDILLLFIFIVAPCACVSLIQKKKLDVSVLTKMIRRHVAHM